MKIRSLLAFISLLKHIQSGIEVPKKMELVMEEIGI